MDYRARPLKTYSQLGEDRRVLSRYERVSSSLLYYPHKPGSVRNPVTAWHDRYQRESSLQIPDPEAFRDPAALTYRDYVARQRDASVFDDAVFRRAPAPSSVSPTWSAILRGGVGPMRYPYHALGMMAAYVGSLAPSGRMVICATFQAANSVRRVHGFARLLAQREPVIGSIEPHARQSWETEPAWQPLRRVVEQALTCWDFGAAFAWLNLVLQPALDELVFDSLAHAAKQHNDHFLASLLGSLGEDSMWQQAWSRAFVETAIQQRPENRTVLREHVRRFRPPVDEALAVLAPLLHCDVHSFHARTQLLQASGLDEDTDAT